MAGRCGPERYVTAAELHAMLSMQEQLAAAIRRRRLALGLSQLQLAAAVRTPRPLVSRVERGTHTITIDTLIRYARGLGCTVTDLVSEAESRGTNARAIDREVVPA
jgi:transcriptional regulator with XRE-family HTH domain